VFHILRYASKRDAILVSRPKSGLFTAPPSQALCTSPCLTSPRPLRYRHTSRHPVQIALRRSFGCVADPRYRPACDDDRECLPGSVCNPCDGTAAYPCIDCRQPGCLPLLCSFDDECPAGCDIAADEAIGQHKVLPNLSTERGWGLEEPKR
jgi:hypothetical protein